MYELYEILGFIIVFFVGLFTSFASMPVVMRKMKSLGIVGSDIHKRNRPSIPEMGGIGLLTGLSVSTLAASFLFPERVPLFASFVVTTLIAGFVGAVDDLKTLSPKVKPFLTLFAGLPILVLGGYFPDLYDPHLVLPIIGRTRLTIIYPLMIPLSLIHI